MTVEVFLTLLSICSVVSSLVTEAVKKFLDSIKIKYATNVVVLIVSMVIGGAVSTIYFMQDPSVVIDHQITFTVVIVVANWLVAMLGYDKIVQTITQFKDGKTTVE